MNEMNQKLVEVETTGQGEVINRQACKYRLGIARKFIVNIFRLLERSETSESRPLSQTKMAFDRSETGESKPVRIFAQFVYRLLPMLNYNNYV